MRNDLPFPAIPQLAVAVLLASTTPAAPSLAATPAELLEHYTVQAQTLGNAARGQQLFSARHGGKWSCASCHGMPPTQTGRHAATGKAIAPLAPAENGERFTDLAKAEKWFRRNCNDVLSRACTAAEKADVLTWLLSLER